MTSKKWLFRIYVKYFNGVTKTEINSSSREYMTAALHCEPVSQRNSFQDAKCNHQIKCTPKECKIHSSLF